MSETCPDTDAFAQETMKRAAGDATTRPEQIGRYRIERLLGEGGFGLVYLAFDDQLVRRVAIKVQRGLLSDRPGSSENYLKEARIVASLDHAHIVPVHDVGTTEDGLFYVVSKYIEGSDLATRIASSRLSVRESAGLVANVADALHYAHMKGLVHRDVKPANILLDAAGKPFVADFGLALRDEDFGRGARIAGTPAYMSPEQAKGEGHRVDGRSDIFSLGVVLYELLTGRRPFRGRSNQEIMEQIAETEVRPPRQADDSIPKEIERICLKAMSRRAAERYSIALDMAEDLRYFLRTSAATEPATVTHMPISPPPGTTEQITATPPLPLTPRSDSEQAAIPIVPKGLRSFDEQDADFFLELLPGPRDRDGLPESLRFWKSRTERLDSDATFPVGLIYGPSGCGKSSLVKAGLLPRLAKHIVVVYLEATPSDIEQRLLKAIRKALPELPSTLGLVEVLASVRHGRVLRREQKLLLVLDQFEQWLHARHDREQSELVAALRQCDGEHVQAVVMVRDDFWMAATRFMGELEIDLLPDLNVAAVDLFDLRHARKVLLAFGRAYGALPAPPGESSKEQQSFQEQAISGLAQDGKVISVRLALFAEMVKGKPWTPATLREVGGTAGIGVTFLEETFCTPQSNPRYRLHQKAAQAVLKALLPESRADLKGRMRSETELRTASGYASRPKDFEDLIRILDRELRLITPTDLELSGTEGQPATPGGERYFQLSHDYLVQSLREWLAGKQRETRRGRAELRLAELASLWNAKPENRYLPTPLEYASIRCRTRSKDWSDPQRKMMRRAARVHGVRSTMMAAGLAALMSAGLYARNRYEETNQATVAAGLVQELLKADISQVPEIVQNLAPYRRWTDRELKRVVADASDNPRAKLHASLALLPVDATRVAYVESQLLQAAPADLPVLRSALAPYRAELTPRLWSLLESTRSGNPQVLRAAAALALYDADSTRWSDSVGKVVRTLVAVNPVFLGNWLDALRPVRGRLTAGLTAILRDKERPETERTLAINILADYARDDADLIANLLLEAEPSAYQALFPVAQHLAEKSVPIFQAELGKQAVFDWNDPPLDKTWTKLDPALAARIEAFGGLVDERFAACQTMPLDDFRSTAEALRPSGYRPVRVRPYADGEVVRVAAVWTRDKQAWLMSLGGTAEEMRREQEQNRKNGFLPVDVAGYVAADTSGKMADRYAAVWVQGDEDRSRFYVGVTSAQVLVLHDRLKADKLAPRTFHEMRGSDGQARYCGIWGPSTNPGGFWRGEETEQSIDQYLLGHREKMLLDVAVCESSQLPSPRQRARNAIATAEKTLAAKPNDPASRFMRGAAYFALGEYKKAIDDLDVVINLAPKETASEATATRKTAAVLAYQYRAIAHARLGQKAEALADLQKHQVENSFEHARLSLAVIVTAELGEGTDQAIAELEAAIHRQPRNIALLYDAASAYALISQAFAKNDPKQSRACAERSIHYLEAALQNGYSNFDHILVDIDLDPVRDLPGFAAILKTGHVERRYAAVWTTEMAGETVASIGLEPAAHLKRCQELAAQGYRLISLSVTRINLEGALVTASAWRRPAIADQVKDLLAERQARAAVALVRLGKAEAVWPLLRHSPEPRLRSFLVNWFAPLGADFKTATARLERIPADLAPATAPGQQPMESVLFHPDVSLRRALILVLGTYAQGLSPGEREPVVDKLLDLYRSDPDSGVHGAAEWTLRQWGQEDRLKAIDKELSKRKDRGPRRWFINGQGQTMAVIEGPVEFLMGSPPTEPEANLIAEARHRTRIGRRFAIGTKEVTSAQFQPFAAENAQHSGLNRKIDGNLPQPLIAWFDAAAYCNWLSAREGIPEAQWCYEPNRDGQYADGMNLASDWQERTGYRLPTEAEWEYACRSGTVTSRFHGDSLELLVNYAWFKQVRDTGFAVGSLKPNDLGLFDVLGNVYEWVQDEAKLYTLQPDGTASNDVAGLPTIRGSVKRVQRGGAYSDNPRGIRSAFRGDYLPWYRYSNTGFRVARTLP